MDTTPNYTRTAANPLTIRDLIDVAGGDLDTPLAMTLDDPGFILGSITPILDDKRPRLHGRSVVVLCVTNLETGSHSARVPD